MASGDGRQLGDRPHKHLLATGPVDIVTPVMRINSWKNDHSRLVVNMALEILNECRMLIRGEASGDIDAIENASVRSDVGQRVCGTVPASPDPHSVPTFEQEVVHHECLQREPGITV
ncbi:hypothetical protein JCM30237_24490 [Halolamina litorea]